MYKKLTEAEDQQEVLKMLQEIDLGEEISTEKQKNIWNNLFFNYYDCKT